jgi:hypothetical protein
VTPQNLPIAVGFIEYNTFTPFKDEKAFKFTISMIRSLRYVDELGN